MLERHDAEVVAEGEVVDDGWPQPIIELKSLQRGLGQLSQIDDGPRGKYPRPDLPQLAVAQPKRINQPLQIQRRRVRTDLRVTADDRDSHRASGPLPDIDTVFKIHEESARDLC